MTTSAQGSEECDKLLPPRAMSTNSVRTAKNGAGGGSPATVLTVLLILLLLGGMVAIVLRRDGWLNEGLKDMEFAKKSVVESSHLFLARARPTGPSLFCWALIMANSSEEELMRQHRSSATGIFRCDAWFLLSDFPVHFQDVSSTTIGAFNSKRAPWNSWYNVPVFLRAWKKVLEDQRFRSYDWTVKVDMDTFFCHERLRRRLQNASVPADEACIWLNYDAAKNPGPLDFLGPMEIFSKEAVKLYEQKHEEVCPRPHPQTQGEDAFMKDCFLKLGAKTRTDYGLLHNACDWCEPLTPKQCEDSRHVAFHPFKKVKLYSECLEEASRDTSCIGPRP